MLHTDTLVSAKGGNLHALSPEGEVLFSVPVAPGRHAASDFLALHGGEWKAEGVVAIAQRVLGGVTVHPEWTETGANPDFVPTSATALEVEMRKQVETMRMLNTTVARKIAEREKIVAMKMAPVVVDDKAMAPVVVDDKAGDGAAVVE